WAIQHRKSIPLRIVVMSTLFFAGIHATIVGGYDNEPVFDSKIGTVCQSINHLAYLFIYIRNCCYNMWFYYSIFTIKTVCYPALLNAAQMYHQDIRSGFAVVFDTRYRRLCGSRIIAQQLSAIHVV